MQVTIATLQLTLPTLLGMGVTLGCSMLILCTWTLIAPDHDPLVWERQVLVIAAASDYSICYEMLSDLLISSQEQDVGAGYCVAQQIYLSLLTLPASQRQMMKGGAQPCKQHSGLWL